MRATNLWMETIPTHTCCSSSWVGDAEWTLTQGIVHHSSIPPQDRRTWAGYRGFWPGGCPCQPQVDWCDQSAAACGSSWRWSAAESCSCFMWMRNPKPVAWLCLLCSIALPLCLFSVLEKECILLGPIYAFIYMTLWTLQMWRGSGHSCLIWFHLECKGYFLFFPAVAVGTQLLKVVEIEQK